MQVPDQTVDFGAFARVLRESRHLPPEVQTILRSSLSFSHLGEEANGRETIRLDFTAALERQRCGAIVTLGEEDPSEPLIGGSQIRLQSEDLTEGLSRFVQISILLLRTCEQEM